MEKNNWEEMYKKEHKLRQEAEKELNEIKEDNKKLSLQVEDSIDRMRKAGLI